MTSPEFEPRIATMEISELETVLKEISKKIDDKASRIKEIEEILNDQEYMDEHDGDKLSVEKIIELEDDMGILKGEIELLRVQFKETSKEKGSVLKRNTLLN